jgi:hypothetical protein
MFINDVTQMGKGEGLPWCHARASMVVAQGIGGGQKSFKIGLWKLGFAPKYMIQKAEFSFALFREI